MSVECNNSVAVTHVDNEKAINTVRVQSVKQAHVPRTWVVSQSFD